RRQDISFHVCYELSPSAYHIVFVLFHESNGLDHVSEQYGPLDPTSAFQRLIEIVLKHLPRRSLGNIPSEAALPAARPCSSHCAQTTIPKSVCSADAANASHSCANHWRVTYEVSHIDRNSSARTILRYRGARGWIVSATAACGVG